MGRIGRMGRVWGMGKIKREVEKMRRVEVRFQI